MPLSPLLHRDTEDQNFSAHVPKMPLRYPPTMSKALNPRYQSRIYMQKAWELNPANAANVRNQPSLKMRLHRSWILRCRPTRPNPHFCCQQHLPQELYSGENRLRTGAKFLRVSSVLRDSELFQISVNVPDSDLKSIQRNDKPVKEVQIFSAANLQDMRVLRHREKKLFSVPLIL